MNNLLYRFTIGKSFSVIILMNKVITSDRKMGSKDSTLLTHYVGSFVDLFHLNFTKLNGLSFNKTIHTCAFLFGSNMFTALISRNLQTYLESILIHQLSFAEV